MEFVIFALFCVLNWISMDLFFVKFFYILLLFITLHFICWTISCFICLKLFSLTFRLLRIEINQTNFYLLSFGYPHFTQLSQYWSSMKNLTVLIIFCFCLQIWLTLKVQYDLKFGWFFVLWFIALSRLNLHSMFLIFRLENLQSIPVFIWAF